MNQIALVLADDYPVVRHGLRSLLAAETDFHVVGETGDGLETVEMVGRLHPDILVLDLVMRGLNGLDVLRQVRKRSPQTRVLILSMHANEAYVVETLQNGASGYVLKSSLGAELVRAVREVAAGRRYLSAPFSESAMDAYLQRTREAPSDAYETLTMREREVLHLSSEGHTAQQIADRLFISPRTVETHRRNLMRKLDLHTQTDLVGYARQKGLIPTGD